MQTWFSHTLPGRWLDAAGRFPVKLLSRVLPAKEQRGALAAHEWLLLVLFPLMFCVPHIYWNNLYGVAFAVIALLLYWRDCAAEGREPMPLSSLGAGAWVFLIFCFLCTLWAGYKASSLRVALFYLAGAVLLYAVSDSFGTEAKKDRLMLFLFVSLLVTAVYGLLDYILHDQAYGVPIGGEILDRLCSTMEHAINYGEYIAMLFPLCLVWLLQRKGKKRWWALALLLPLAALLLTYARTGWIALAFALFLLALFYDKRTIIPMLILGVIGILLMPASIRERFLSMLQFSDNASSGRFTLWSECLAMLRDRWLLGIGLGRDNFFNTYLGYCTGVLDFSPPHANMGYLEIFLSLGIFGFLGFILFFFRIFPRLRKARLARPGRRERAPLMALTASLAAAALANIPEHIWFYPRVLWCWCLVYGLALGAAAEE